MLLTPMLKQHHAIIACVLNMLSHSSNATRKGSVFFSQAMVVGQFMLENLLETNLEESLSHREYIVWSMVL